MAITAAGKSPIIMDAAADDLATVFQGRDMNDTAGIPKLYVVGIEFVQGASGKTVLKDRAAGQIIAESPTLGAGENYYVRIGRWLDGCYVDSIPASSKVFLHYA